MKMKKLPVGKSDFKQIIQENYCYVDKTLFIKEVIDKGDSILLIPRPRRFGKTLNLSMLKYFYDCCPQWPPIPGTPSLANIDNIARETGPLNSYKKLFDRYDIMIIPKDTGKLGFIIEFKKTRKKETLESAVKSALEQIENRKYESELLQRGIEKYKKLAVVFKGKEVIVKEG